MNKITPAVLLLMQHILELCVRINNETDHSAFCDFAGHVNSLSVRVSTSDYRDKILSMDCYVDHEGSDDLLQNIQAELTKILEDAS